MTACGGAARQGGILIVGDVKQSIYRFRDSDWELLGGEVEREFPDAQTETMQCNWRSSRTVVGFNNRFFTYAAAQLGLSEIYADYRLEPRKKDIGDDADNTGPHNRFFTGLLAAVILTQILYITHGLCPPLYPFRVPQLFDSPFPEVLQNPSHHRARRHREKPGLKFDPERSFDNTILSAF